MQGVQTYCVRWFRHQLTPELDLDRITASPAKAHFIFRNNDTKMPSAIGHNYSFTLQKYMLLQEQHQQLCYNLDQIRPRKSSISSSVSTMSSPGISPTRSSSSPKRHSRSSGQRRHSRASARYSGWDDGQDCLDTILDEDTLYQISAEEQRLFDVNESIKRALTELLNCDAVRSDNSTRMWAQARLMETEKELRSGRRRKSTPCMD